jgi:hypothetical protein
MVTGETILAWLNDLTPEQRALPVYVRAEDSGQVVDAPLVSGTIQNGAFLLGADSAERADG